MKARCLLAAAIIVFACGNLLAADNRTRRLLLVTDSGGFVHDSVGLAETILKDIGPQNGFAVTAWRYTRDPEARIKVKGKEVLLLEDYARKFRARTGMGVQKENCGRINKDTLKNFDIVLFFTTGNPLTKSELVDLQDWVKAGGAFAGTHCATDTLYNTTYGALVGGYFDGHPWHQKIKIRVEDPKHAAAAGFKSGDEITDEIYQFRDVPYSRGKLHILLSVDNSSINVKKGKRKDGDYAIAWCQQYGKGRTFYTSLGHRKEVWKDARFQKHLIGGLKWVTQQAEGSSAPSGK